MSNTHFVLDFDGTLFDVEPLWEEWLNRLEEAEVDRGEAIEVGERFFGLGYHPHKHASELGLSGAELDELVSSFEEWAQFEAPSLVYKEVGSFVQQYQSTILTFGDPEHQQFKVEAAGLDEFIADVRVARPERLKIVHLKELCEEEDQTIVFVDDNPRELEAVRDLGLPVTLVRMRREGARHADLPHEGDDVDWQCVASLEEIEVE